MSNAVSAQGTSWYISSLPVPAGSPIDFVRIAEVKTFSNEGDRPEIDVTNLDSTAREYRLGLQDNGTFSLELNYLKTDVGHIKMREARASIYPYEFKVVYSDGGIDTFQGLVKQFPRPSGGVDGVLDQTAQIRVTGSVLSV